MNNEQLLNYQKQNFKPKVANKVLIGFQKVEMHAFPRLRHTSIDIASFPLTIELQSNPPSPSPPTALSLSHREHRHFAKANHYHKPLHRPEPNCSPRPPRCAILPLYNLQMWPTWLLRPWSASKVTHTTVLKSSVGNTSLHYSCRELSRL